VQLRAAAQFDRRAAGATTGPAFLIGHLITVTLVIRLHSRWPEPDAVSIRHAADVTPEEINISS